MRSFSSGAFIIGDSLGKIKADVIRRKEDNRKILLRRCMRIDNIITVIAGCVAFGNSRFNNGVIDQLAVL